MPRAAHPAPAVIPLLAWRELAAINAMAAERAALKERIAALPRNSHRRIILQARLEELTATWLAALVALKGGRS